MRFDNTPLAPPTTSAPAEWSDLKGRIVRGLDVAAEFERLGVRFSKPSADHRGVRECHAVGRKDDVPSAFVNVKTAVYHDSGGEGVSLHLFDFALRHGEHGRWIDVVRHYAAAAGVDAAEGFRPGKNGRVREAVYYYRDRDGAVRYSVHRYRLPNGKKTFSQHPPDGKGGWKFGPGCMDGVEPLPYRLPEILGSAGNPASDDDAEPVWVVEGEKDADRLASLGLVATTNHQGAQSTDATWPKFVEYFRGREVFVLPDNDPGGRAHARKVAAYLSGVAGSVKVVDLPGLPPKGDVSDWLDAGHDLDGLGRLAKAAPEWTGAEPGPAEAPAPEAVRDATAADVRAALSAASWLAPGWIPNAELTLLAAEPGVGKTRFCFDLARRIHAGLTWPDGSPITLPRDSKTLWIAADGQWQEIATIPAAFGIPDDLVVLNATNEDPYSGTTLEQEEDFADLESRIKRVRPAIVFIDTITNTADFKAQDASDAKKQYKPLQEIASRCQTAIVCVTHLNASGKVLGRRAAEKVRVVVQIECPDPEGQPNRRKLWVSKSKAVRPPALGVTMTDEGNEYDAEPPEPPRDGRFGGAKTGPVPAAITACMAWLAARLASGPARVKDLRDQAEAAGYSVTTLYKSKDRLGLSEKEMGVRNHKYWSLDTSRDAGGNDAGAGSAPF